MTIIQQKSDRVESNDLLSRLHDLAAVFPALIPSALQFPGPPPLILPRFLLRGAQGGGDPVRIAIFAGIHGDEPAGCFAIAEFLRQLAKNPLPAAGYHLYCYPICNPTGFNLRTRHSQSGKDLNREFWKKSSEPEVLLLEQEIQSQSFHGLISLHSDDSSSGMYGFVRGAVLTRALLEPALSAAEIVLPRNTQPIIDGFAADNGIISQCYDGILTSPPHIEPLPFEIILETPNLAPLDQQVQALVKAMESILVEYQKLLSFAANL